MRATTRCPRRTTRETAPPAFPDYYAEERWAKARADGRRTRARNALRLVGLLVGVAGLAGALRAWDAGLQP
jgi:hypothetical protein